eukprot:g30122.t1
MQVDWAVFKYTVDELDKDTTTIPDAISKCLQDCVPKKLIPVFPNRKPWMNREIHCLLKTRHAVFKLDNPNLYRKSRNDLCKAFGDAKRQYRYFCYNAYIRLVFLRVSIRKVTGLSGVPCHVLRSSVDQLAEIFIDIFNLSLLQAEVPTSFKKTTIIPVPRKHMQRYWTVSSKVKYQMLFLQFMFGLTLTVEEVKNGHVVRGVEEGIKMD